MLQHCLWKLVSETGFLYNSLLSETECAVLSKLLRRKGALYSIQTDDDPGNEIAVLNSIVDKIVCQIQVLQLESQKQHSISYRNCDIGKEVNSPVTLPKSDNNSPGSAKSGKSINDLGLTKRAARILESMGIDTLEKLRSCSLSRLYNQERIGVKTIHDIETVLSTYDTQTSAGR